MSIKHGSKQYIAIRWGHGSHGYSIKGAAKVRDRRLLRRQQRRAGWVDAEELE